MPSIFNSKQAFAIQVTRSTKIPKMTLIGNVSSSKVKLTPVLFHQAKNMMPSQLKKEKNVESN